MLQLTDQERQALLELVAYKSEDAECYIDEGEEVERYTQELAFWSALENKLVNA